MQNSKAIPEQLSEFLSENKLWSLKEDKLHQEFIFRDFITAFGFMTQMALIAESLNHHPEWSNKYNHVVVNLTTHDCNGISTKDFRLAITMDKIASQLILNS